MAFYPTLIERPEAAIASISSTQGILAAPFLVSYCTTKFAVRGFSDSLRVENQIRNIKNLSVHTVHPGAVATNISLNAQYQGDRSRNFHKILQKRGVTPQHAARKILKGIKNKKSRIFISDGVYQDIVARLFPSSLHIIVKFVLKIIGHK
jgi:short-subunit dehydrogenase